MFEVEVIVLADLETNLKVQSWLVACSERVVGGQRHAPCFLHGIHSIVLKFTLSTSGIQLSKVICTVCF